ncbi:MFS transporter [Novisyntrophococcus fermenticellae]|uniref:MFS transporter n=1 Tax=Novisyntrophococcus fermenticellae TaxID=2068655 RepID=UPI001E2F9609|nr:MFS transporter [Novisyntrophococcus fermenticellae]
MTEKSLSKSQVNRYGFYFFASSLAAMVQMTYVTIFMTDYIGIPTGIVATTLLVARVIDLLVGIICGGIIEKARLPWGKYRSWLLILRWVIIFSLVCSFFDTSSWPLAFRIGVSFIGYMLMNVSMSFTTNAYYGLGPALAGANLSDRFRLSTRGAQFSCIAMLIFSACTIPLVTLLSPIVGGGNAYLAVSVVFAIPYIFGCRMVSNLCKDCDPAVRTGQGGRPVSTVTVMDMVKSVIRNKQLLVVFISYTIYYVALYIFSNLGAYYFTYLVGDFMKMSYSMTVSMITGFIASLIMPKLGGRLGKKKAMVTGFVIYAATCACLFIAGASWILYTLFAAGGGAAIYMFTSFGANYFVDCGEYYLYRTGKDARDVAISMFSVPMKIGMALGGAIATYGLTFIGYQAHMHVDSVFQNRFLILMGILPAALVLFGALVMGIGYKITDHDAQMYAEENAKKAAAKSNLAEQRIS